MQSTVAQRLPMRSTWQRTRDFLQYRLSHWLLILFLLAASAIVLAPFAWTVSTSMRLPIESFSVPPQWIVLDPDWSNYTEVFERIPFWHQLLNSATVAVTIVVGQLTTTSLAGYAFAQLQFPGKNVLFWLVMATMMVPLQATIIPVFILLSRMGLPDTLASLILPSLTAAFGTFLLRQYFMSIPKEYEEAAVIDGAGPFRVFYQLYLPLVKPGLAVLAVLAFNFHWNEFFRPLIFLLTQEKFTIPLGLNDLKGYMMTGSISVVLAGVTLSLIPVVIVYIIGQRFLIEGIMKGGLKA